VAFALLTEKKFEDFLINGMYALAFYDNQLKNVSLMRDSLGKKPLYFSKSENSLRFSSLIECFENGGNLTFSKPFLAQYLRLGFGIDPMTPYRELYALKPGFRIDASIIDGSKLHFEEKESKPIQRPPKGAKEKLNLRETVLEAIQKRVAGHSDISLSLSGGIDSAIIAVGLSILGVRSHCYSVVWPDADKERYNEDSRYAASIAKALKHDFTLVQTFYAKELPDYLDRYLDIMGEPNNNPTGLSMIPLYEKISKDGYRISLTGDGADEVFAGYRRYASLKKYSTISALWPGFLRHLRHVNSTFKLIDALKVCDYESWAYWHGIFSPQDITEDFSISLEEYLKGMTPVRDIVQSSKSSFFSDPVQVMMDSDKRIWLSMESNRRLDRISMAFSVEARSPFQDLEILELGKRTTLVNQEPVKKQLLREAFPELSKLDLQPVKSGFISPLGNWLRFNAEYVKANIKSLYLGKLLKVDYSERVDVWINSGDLRKLQKIWTLFVLSRWLSKRQNRKFD